MTRTLYIYPRALDDIEVCATYIRRHVSTKSMDKWLKMLRSELEKLKKTAEIWAQYELAELRGVDLRVFLCGRQRHVYQVLYTYTANLITVHRVRHASQDAIDEGEL